MIQKRKWFRADENEDENEGGNDLERENDSKWKNDSFGTAAGYGNENG